MLSITRKDQEALVIFPGEGLDPNMKVADLFRDGPIRIGIRRTDGNKTRVDIDSPRVLTVLREELLEKRPCQD